MWFDVCALGRLVCITGSDFDCRCEERVGELVVSVLTLFTSGRLVHDLQECGFFDPVCCGFYGANLPMLSVSQKMFPSEMQCPLSKHEDALPNSYESCGKLVRRLSR